MTVDVTRKPSYIISLIDRRIGQNDEVVARTPQTAISGVHFNYFGLPWQPPRLTSLFNTHVKSTKLESSYSGSASILFNFDVKIMFTKKNL
jgi:hypothetical protein